MENFDQLLKETFNKQEYRKDIERAIVNKLIESINYKLNDEIYKLVEEQFDVTYKAEISKTLEASREYIKTTISTIIKKKMEEVADRIIFQPYEWDLKKFIESGLKIIEKK